jgi:dihydroorotate dehydrogenase electron transfer subunit
MTAQFGRRAARITDNRASGSYRVFSADDPEGPDPRAGQFYMLAAESGWGGDGERPYLGRAFSVALAERGPGGVRLDFLVEPVGPGTERLAALGPGEDLWLHGPLGRPFSAPGALSGKGAGGSRPAILVGGGIGVAPLAILERELRASGTPTTILLGFRDEGHAGGIDLFDGDPELASEDGHLGHRGYVTDLLAPLLSGGDPAAVYACGPPAMLEAVRALCAEHETPCQLAMEAPMACGFGACFGCAVPLRGGGYLRLCLDGPVVDAAAIETALVPGSGHGPPVVPAGRGLR